MKAIIRLVLMLLVISSCTEKDPYELVNDTKPTVISTSDLDLTIQEMMYMNGDSIGTVKGTSNKGTVDFTIVSQVPANAMDIGVRGQLIVNDESLLVEGTEVILEVEVSKNDETKLANVTINVITGCPSVDLSVFDGTLDFLSEDEIFDIRDEGQGVGVAENCSRLKIIGDIAFFRCDTGITPELTLVLEPFDDNSGSVTLNRVSYDCAADIDLDISATGTYNLSEKTISLMYSLTLIEEDLTAQNEVLITGTN